MGKDRAKPQPPSVGGADTSNGGTARVVFWGALVVLGGVATGILASWIFTGEYTDYRAFPTLFQPPEDFSVGRGEVLAITAAFAVVFTLAWLACGRLGVGRGEGRGSIVDRLALDARLFLSLASPGIISILMGLGVDPGLASLFVLMIAVIPPLALLACRVATRAADIMAAGARQHASYVILLLMTAAFCLLFAIQTIRQYHALNLGYADSGYVAEALSNTLRGKFFWCNSLTFGNYFGDHFSPILILLVPVYALFPAHETLLAVHSLAIGVGAIPVYLLTRRLAGSQFAGLALAAAYLLHPAVQFQNFCFSYAFKAASLSLPLLLWAAYFALARRSGLFILFSVLSLACEESLVPVVLCLGIYAALSRRTKAGWLVAGLAVAWWVGATQLVMPHVRGGTPSKQLRTFYGWMGRSPAEIVLFMVGHPLKVLRRFLDREVFVFLAQMTLPVAMLCFLSPGALAVGAVTFVFLALSGQTAFLSIYFQYKVGLIPVVFVATAIAVGKLRGSSAVQSLFGRAGTGPRPAPALGCLVVVAAAANCYVFGPTPLSHNYLPGFYKARRYEAVRELQRLVPRTASLLATERVAAHFTGQALLHRLSWEPAVEYDFVLLDLDDKWGGRRETFAERRKYLADSRYVPVYARDGFLLFQKGGRTPPEMQGLGPQEPGIPDGLEDSIKLPAGEGVEIVSLKFKPPLADLPRANTSMHIHWKCLKPIATDRGLTITLAGKSSEGTRTFRRTFHPCLGLFPTSLWKPGMIIADRYDFHLPFDPDEGTMIGFDWKDWLPEKENGPTSGGMSRRDSSPVAID